ncbi:MAG TPA: alpha/beta fold hydrolase [Actinomycetospora sp.]|nr:alpha/beta fold hydrolase [Actinomycetospora sp.]
MIRGRVVARTFALLGAVVLALIAGCAPAAPAPGPCAPAVPGGSVQTVDVPGVRLHVTVAGPVAAPVVVLLHGFPETAATWRAVAVDLAADHRVVVPDLRGAGCSGLAPPGSDAYATRDLAGDLAALAVALRLPAATVVGHDLGAMTAIAWARARPEQVGHLVLSGGGVPGYGLAERGPPHLRTFGDAPRGAVERAERPGSARSWPASPARRPSRSTRRSPPTPRPVASTRPWAATARWTATRRRTAPIPARWRCRCSSWPVARRTSPPRP